MKRILFLLLPLLFVSTALPAEDEFLVLQKRFQDVLSEWSRYTSSEYRSLLRDSPDPKARKLLKFRNEILENFMETSRKIQEDLRGVKSATGLELARHAEYFRGALQLCVGCVETGTTNAMANREALLDQSIQLVKADLSFLKEIGFSCKDGKPAVSAEAQAWPELYRYKRQLQKLMTYMNKVAKNTQMGMAAQKKEFLREFSSIIDAAEALGDKVALKFPDLSDSGILLPIVTRKLLEESQILSSSAKLKSSSSLIPKSDSRTPTERLQQLNSLFQPMESRIHASMQKEEKSQAAPLSDKKNETVRRQSDSARPRKKSDPAVKKEKQIPLERRSEEDLNKELIRLRQQILPDADKKALSSDELEQCLNLLSEKERKQYETIRARRIRNGSDAREASLEALKELKELLMAPGAVLPAKQEKIQILKRAGVRSE